MFYNFYCSKCQKLLQNCHLNSNSEHCAWPYDNDAKVHFRSRVRKSDHNSFKHEFTTTLFLFQIFFVLMDLHRASRWILGPKLPDSELNSKWILLLFLHFCKSTNLFAKTCRTLEINNINKEKIIASSGNRTRAARVAGEHSTTEPTLLRCQLWSK